MSSWTFIVRSLIYYRRTHLAVALGVAAATAVLVGALLVGDSVRGSLRQLTLDRLGSIDEVLVSDRFFRSELAHEWEQSEAFRAHYRTIVPAVMFPSITLDNTSSQPTRRASQVLALGIEAPFWDLGEARFAPEKSPGDDEIVLNAPLAAALQAKVGDELVLRLPSANQVPADSPLGRKSDRIQSAAGLKVIAIIPAESLGRFALRPSQALPLNAYLNTATLQRVLKQDGLVNTLLIAGKSTSSPPTPEQSEALFAELQPTLADFGVRVDRVRRAFRAEMADKEEVVFDYFHITTDRMLFSPEASEQIEQALAPWSPQPMLTYLANTIAKANGQQEIPYSTITAIDSQPGIGPLLDEAGQPVQLGAGEIALNSWSAEDLEAKLGDPLRIVYFAPETAHGEAKEAEATFTLKFIAPLTEPTAGYRRNRPAIFEEKPTTVNDPDLTPVVDGITDQESIAQWDPPFPFDQKRVRPIDDTYWENHRTTPKAFISLAAGQKLWGSRFGSVTSFRVPATAELTEELLRSTLTTALRKHTANLGFALIPVKQQGLLASSGTTPFDVLFLFLSFFIIAAALMLVAVLFKLGVEQRVREVGTLLAVGWQRKQAGWSLLWEAVGVAKIGAILGVLLGIGYAWLMLAGLRTLWVGAITTPFLTFHWSWLSLIAGYFSGVIVSSLTIAASLRQLRSLTSRQLLAGETTSAIHFKQRSALWNWLALGLLIAALGLAALATTLGGEAQAGAFVGAGAAVLTAALLVVWNHLRAPHDSSPAKLALSRLAVAAAQRNPTRSTLTIGLVAAASFLIVAMSSFRLAPTEAGAGGFALVATSSDPIYANLNTPAGRKDLLLDEVPEITGVTILGLRYRAGDDASCNNLYQASQPRVLGITPAFVAHFDQKDAVSFSWAASAATSPEQQRNPWHLLPSATTPAGEPIPVVLDKNTAMYSLHLYRGIGEEFTITYDDQAPLTFRVAGLLSNSILQGSLLLSEADFERYFPNVSGYRYFLIDAPADRSDAVAQILEDKLSDQGFDVQPTAQLLTELLAVQNTYLSTFQSLGALGLLLGTFGLATVQLRSVIERRGELALFQATGFARSRIARLVMTESVVLLLAGLLTGVVAALVAVLPHMVFGGATIPWGELVVLLGAVLAVGLLASLLAVRATLRSDIIGALRGE